MSEVVNEPPMRRSGICLSCLRVWKDRVLNRFNNLGQPDHIDLIIVADVLYDKANFPWLRRFLERASEVLVADSRVKDFDHPPYRQIARRDSCTLPDLDESAEFRDVRIYHAYWSDPH